MESKLYGILNAESSVSETTVLWLLHLTSYSEGAISQCISLMSEDLGENMEALGLQVHVRKHAC